MTPTGLMVGSGNVDTRSPYYQELKSRIHQDLLNRLDLTRLTRMRRRVEVIASNGGSLG